MDCFSSFAISAPAGLTSRCRDVSTIHDHFTISSTTEKDGRGGSGGDVNASIVSMIENDSGCDDQRLSHLQNLVDCLANVKNESPHTTIFTNILPTPQRLGEYNDDNEDALIASIMVSAPPALVSIRGGPDNTTTTTPYCIEEQLRAYTAANTITTTTSTYDVVGAEDADTTDMMMMPPALILSQLDPTSLSPGSSIHIAKWIAHRDHMRRVLALSELMEDQYLVIQRGDDCCHNDDDNNDDGLDIDTTNNNTPATTTLSNRLGVSSSMDNINTSACCGSNVFSMLEGGRSPSFGGVGTSMSLVPPVEACRVLAPILLVPSSSFPSGGDELGCLLPTPISGCRLPSNASSNVNTPRPPSAALLRRPIPSWAGSTEEEEGERGGGGGECDGGVSPGMSDLNASSCSVSTLACTTGSNMVSAITTPHSHHVDPTSAHHQLRGRSSSGVTSFIRRRRSSPRNMLLPPSALVPRLTATQIENDCEISLLNPDHFGGEEEEEEDGGDAELRAVGVGSGGGGGWSPSWSFLNGRSPHNSGGSIMMQPNTTTLSPAAAANSSSSRRLSGNPTLVNICVPASDGLSATASSLPDSSHSRRSVNRQSRGRALSGSSRGSVDHPLFANHPSPSPVTTSDGSTLNTPRLPTTIGIMESTPRGGVHHQQQQYLHAPSPTHPPLPHQHHQNSSNNHHQQQPCTTTFLDNSLTSNDVYAEVGASILSSSGRRFSYDGNIPTNTNNGVFQLHQKGGHRRSRGGSVRSSNNACTTSGGSTPLITGANNQYEDTTPSDAGLNNQGSTPVVVNLLHW